MNVTQGPGKQFLTRLVGLMLIGIVMAFVFSRGYDRMAARRAEPMALPALALLAVGGLAALLLIFAAMRVAGTLIARMADEQAQNAGQIIVVLPTVTPTPEMIAHVGNVQQVGERLGSSDGAGGLGGK